jgi:hypothetical protein
MSMDLLDNLPISSPVWLGLAREVRIYQKVNLNTLKDYFSTSLFIKYEFWVPGIDPNKPEHWVNSLVQLFISNREKISKW